MLKIESLREELYKAIEEGNGEIILNISRKLDALILNYTKNTHNPKIFQQPRN